MLQYEMNVKNRSIYREYGKILYFFSVEANAKYTQSYARYLALVGPFMVQQDTRLIYKSEEVINIVSEANEICELIGLSENCNRDYLVGCNICLFSGF